MPTIKSTDETFDNIVKENKIVLTDFWVRYFLLTYSNYYLYPRPINKSRGLFEIGDYYNFLLFRKK